MRFVPFQDEFLPQAAELLAERHRQERVVYPELPPDFTAPNRALTVLEAEWKRPGTTGTALLDEGQRLIGYLIGSRLVDLFWGRSVWVRYPGMALAKGLSEELYRSMYAYAGPLWVEQGYFKHFTFAPTANSSLIDAWLRLGFSYQQSYALLDLRRTENEEPKLPGDISIRRAHASDAEALRRVAEWIRGYQAQSPGWSPIFPETLEELRNGYAGIVEDPEADLWLAVRGEEIVGFNAYWPATSGDTDTMIPAKCVELKVAATKPGERGKGIGRALTAFCLKELRSRGYQYCTADWYVLNLLSSTFWPRLGFRPVAHRLVRSVDERVAWANVTAIGRS